MRAFLFALKISRASAEGKPELSMAQPLDLDSLRTVLESLPTGVYIVDRDRKILLWNRGAEQISGFLAQDVIGRHCSENLLGHCNVEERCICTTHCPLNETMRDGQTRQAELFLRHKDGHRVAVRIRAVPLRDENGTIIGAAESFDEYRFADRRERLLTPLEGIDTLSRVTDLPVNNITAEVLQEHVEAFARHLAPFSILRIHLDRLAQFRKDRGLEPADALLKVIAQTIRTVMKSSDFLGCWAENEFLAIIATRRPHALEKVAERIRSLVSSAGVVWWGDLVSLTVSVGGVVIEPADTAEMLLDRADLALETCLQNGGNRIEIRTLEVAKEHKG